jgi:hypothetical protein
VAKDKTVTLTPSQLTAKRDWRPSHGTVELVRERRPSGLACMERLYVAED